MAARRMAHARRAFSLLELQVAFTLLSLALAGLVPLLVMQSRHLWRLESKVDLNAVHHLVPAANDWARRLGVPATRSTDVPGPTTFPTRGFINFQRPQDPPPGAFQENSYRGDGGDIFGDRGGGYYYGWNRDNTAASRNRDRPKISPDERYDTLIHMQQSGTFTWEVAVPNGLYRVRVVAGDPSYIDSIYVINAEGLPVVAGIPTLLESWFEGTTVTLVLDGRLTISNAVGSVNNKICFIDYELVALPNVVKIKSLTKSMTGDAISVDLDIEPKQ